MTFSEPDPRRADRPAVRSPGRAPRGNPVRTAAALLVVTALSVGSLGGGPAAGAVRAGHAAGPVARTAGPTAAPGAAGTVRLVVQEDSGVRSASVPLSSRPSHYRLRTNRYAAVAFTWRGADPALAFRSRTRHGWGHWRYPDTLEDGPGGAPLELRGSDLVWVEAARGIRVRVSGQGFRALRLVLIDPGQRAADRHAEGSEPEGVGGSGPLSRRAPEPSMRWRYQWGANESWRSGTPTINRTIQQVHIHHTVNVNSYRRREVPAMIRAMYRYHTRYLGWSDIGYNFLVDRFGRIWVGRAGGRRKPVRGAHTLGFNETSVGISVIGNFELRRPSKPARWAVARLAAWKLDMYRRPPRGWARVYSHGSDRYPAGTWATLRVLAGHRDTNATACPGRYLYELLPRIRRLTKRAIDRARNADG